MGSKSLATAVLLAVAACGGGTQQRTTPTDERPPEASPPPEPWAEMDFAERKRYMGERVLPVMAAVFQTEGPEAYTGFGCDSCHGPDPASLDFAMPSPHLPELHPTGSPEQKQMVRDHPEMVRFMFNDVVPSMKTLLGLPEYDEDTGEGFSCFYCHPKAGSEELATRSLHRQR